MTTSTQNIKNIINNVGDLNKAFENFKSQMNSIFVKPFDFIEFLQLDLRLKDEKEEFIKGEDILNLFKDTKNSIKNEFTSFLKSEIMDKIQLLGIK